MIAKSKSELTSEPAHFVVRESEKDDKVRHFTPAQKSETINSVFSVV